MPAKFLRCFRQTEYVFGAWPPWTLFAQASQSVGRAGAAYDGHVPGGQYWLSRRLTHDVLLPQQTPGRCAGPVRGIVGQGWQMSVDSPPGLSAPVWVWSRTACGCARRAMPRTARLVCPTGAAQTDRAPPPASAWLGPAETTRRNSGA